MSPPDHILEALREANWEDIYPSLVAYAKTRLWSLPSVRARGSFPKDLSPKEVAQEAIRLVFQGDRNWDPIKHPDLGLYLATSVARSLITNAVGSAENRKRADFGSSDNELDSFARDEHDPSILVASLECEEALREIIESATADDENLAVVQMGLEDGMRSAEIAELLSIRVEEVYVLTRKLRRRLTVAMSVHECWEDHILIPNSATPQ